MTIIKVSKSATRKHENETTSVSLEVNLSLKLQHTAESDICFVPKHDKKIDF